MNPPASPTAAGVTTGDDQSSHHEDIRPAVLQERPDEADQEHDLTEVSRRLSALIPLWILELAQAAALDSAGQRRTTKAKAAGKSEASSSIASSEPRDRLEDLRSMDPQEFTGACLVIPVRHLLLPIVEANESLEGGSQTEPLIAAAQSAISAIISTVQKWGGDVLSLQPEKVGVGDCIVAFWRAKDTNTVRLTPLTRDMLAAQLRNPLWRAWFKRLAISKASEESLLFWEACQQHSKLCHSLQEQLHAQVDVLDQPAVEKRMRALQPLLQMTKDIIKTFILNDAPQQVNISSELREHVSAAQPQELVNPNLFQWVLKEVVDLMNLNLYRPAFQSQAPSIIANHQSLSAQNAVLCAVELSSMADVFQNSTNQGLYVDFGTLRTWAGPTSSGAAVALLSDMLDRAEKVLSKPRTERGPGYPVLIASEALPYLRQPKLPETLDFTIADQTICFNFVTQPVEPGYVALGDVQAAPLQGLREALEAKLLTKKTKTFSGADVVSALQQLGVETEEEAKMIADLLCATHVLVPHRTMTLSIDPSALDASLRVPETEPDHVLHFFPHLRLVASSSNPPVCIQLQQYMFSAASPHFSLAALPPKIAFPHYGGREGHPADRAQLAVTQLSNSGEFPAAVSIFLPSYVRYVALKHNLTDSQAAATFRTVAVLTIHIRLMATLAVCDDDLHAALDAVAALAGQYEGVVHSIFFTDAEHVRCVVIFGFPPHSHQDDPLRATSLGLSALRQIRKLQSLNPKPTLMASIGISAGRVGLLAFGSETRTLPLVLGLAVPRASQLAELISEGMSPEEANAAPLILVDSTVQHTCRQLASFADYLSPSGANTQQREKCFVPLSIGNAKADAMFVGRAAELQAMISALADYVGSQASAVASPAVVSGSFRGSRRGPRNKVLSLPTGEIVLSGAASPKTVTPTTLANTSPPTATRTTASVSTSPKSTRLHVSPPSVARPLSPPTVARPLSELSPRAAAQHTGETSPRSVRYASPDPTQSHRGFLRPSRHVAHTTPSELLSTYGAHARHAPPDLSSPFSGAFRITEPAKRPSAVVIEGAEGSGKTALLAHFSQYVVKTHGLPVWRLDCYSFQRGTPFYPFRELLMNMMHLNSLPDSHARRDAVLDALLGIDPELLHQPSLVRQMLHVINNTLSIRVSQKLPVAVQHRMALAVAKMSYHQPQTQNTSAIPQISKLRLARLDVRPARSNSAGTGRSDQDQDHRSQSSHSAAGVSTEGSHHLSGLDDKTILSGLNAKLSDKGAADPFNAPVSDENSRILLRILVLLLKDSPNIILIDNIHNMDISSWSLLEQLLKIELLPLGLVCTIRHITASRAPEVNGSRPEPQPDGDGEGEEQEVTDSLSGESEDGTPDEEHALWQRKYEALSALENIRAFVLPPLAAADVVMLVTKLLDAKAVDVPVARKVMQWSQGLPLLVVDVVSSLIDEKELRITAAGLVEFSSEGGPAVPSTMQQIVRRRLDKLPRTAQMTAKVASAQGRVVRRTLVEKVHPVQHSASEIEADFEILQRAGLLRLTTLDPEPLYEFNSNATAESLYLSLSSMQRQQLHVTLAQSIEAAYSSDLTPFFSILAFHWLHALDKPRAISYFETAARHALSQQAYQEAIALFESALKTYTHDLQHNQAKDGFSEWVGDQAREEAVAIERELAENDGAVPMTEIVTPSNSSQAYQQYLSDAEQRISLFRLDVEHLASIHRMLGEAYVALGDLDAGFGCLRLALDFLGSPLPDTSGKMLASLIGGGVKQVLHYLAPRWFVGKNVLRQESLREVVLTQDRIFEILFYQGNHWGALQVLLKSLNLAEEMGAQDLLPRLYANAFVVAREFSLPHPLIEHLSARAWETAVANKDSHAQGYVSLLRAINFIGTGIWKEAAEALDHAAHIYHDTGSPRFGDCMGLAGTAHYLMAEFDHSMQSFSQLSEFGRHEMDNFSLNWGIVSRANVAMDIGWEDMATSLIAERANLIGASNLADKASWRLSEHTIKALIACRNIDRKQHPDVVEERSEATLQLIQNATKRGAAELMAESAQLLRACLEGADNGGIQMVFPLTFILRAVFRYVRLRAAGSETEWSRDVGDSQSDSSEAESIFPMSAAQSLAQLALDALREFARRFPVLQPRLALMQGRMLEEFEPAPSTEQARRQFETRRTARLVALWRPALATAGHLSLLGDLAWLRFHLGRVQPGNAGEYLVRDAQDLFHSLLPSQHPFIRACDQELQLRVNRTLNSSASYLIWD
eukprot:TRINITY_DN2214_c0_g1_i2.p1 TRINITY_DN2214_c0_g1~~TRINITY_DN2214_c0_g1_i2.p1  ORF type:complete len:2240 (-),score=451.67 TRINITY_DN2214_c0_g1_i2:65-6784(-)